MAALSLRVRQMAVERFVENGPGKLTASIEILGKDRGGTTHDGLVPRAVDRSGGAGFGGIVPCFRLSAGGFIIDSIFDEIISGVRLRPPLAEAAV